MKWGRNGSIARILAQKEQEKENLSAIEDARETGLLRVKNPPFQPFPAKPPLLPFRLRNTAVFAIIKGFISTQTYV
jgi:hypothetical protein